MDSAQAALPSAPNHQPEIQTHELGNDLCSVSVAVSEGGRVSAFRSLRTGLEFLTQAHHHRSPVVPGLATPFQTGPCAGIEECLPTVGPSGPGTIGGAAPDHGDFWQIPWRVVQAEGSSRLLLEASGFSRPFLFRKDLSLNGTTLRIVYTLQNLGQERLPFLYACHPLVAVDRGDRITLPSEVNMLHLYYSRNNRLGHRGDTANWPISATGEALDRAGGAEDGTAEMFYTAKLSRESCCAIQRQVTGESLEVLFSPEALPYLGLWLCYGGWPDDAEGPRQFAVAFEPTTSPCNTLAEAVASGTAAWVAPRATASWQICFRLSRAVSR